MRAPFFRNFGNDLKQYYLKVFNLFKDKVFNKNHFIVTKTKQKFC